MMSLAMDETNILMSDYWVPAGLMPMNESKEIDVSVVDEAAKMLGFKDYE
jgi:hypothetical protein